MKIYYKAPYEIGFIEKGEWVDLRCKEDVETEMPFKNQFGEIIFNPVKYADNSYLSPGGPLMIDTGFAMQIPKGFEAILAPRSSAYKSFGIIMSNSIGIIDSSYCGDKDTWRFPAICFKKTRINKNERICQFRLQPSQKATIWQKLRWLFTRQIKFVKVDVLTGVNRGGFGTTGNE